MERVRDRKNISHKLWSGFTIILRILGYNNNNMYLQFNSFIPVYDVST